MTFHFQSRAEITRLRVELRLAHNDVALLQTEIGVVQAQRNITRQWLVTLGDTIDRIKALHTITPEHFEECGRSCEGCHEVWPCPTILALREQENIQ
jgi:hypothetical protein